MTEEEAEDEPLHEYFGFIYTDFEGLIDASHPDAVNGGVKLGHQPEVLAEPEQLVEGWIGVFRKRASEPGVSEHVVEGLMRGLPGVSDELRRF